MYQAHAGSMQSRAEVGTEQKGEGAMAVARVSATFLASLWIEIRWEGQIPKLPSQAGCD